MKLTEYKSWLLPIWYLVSLKLGFQIKSQHMTFVEANKLYILIIFHAFSYGNVLFIIGNTLMETYFRQKIRKFHYYFKQPRDHS